MVKGLKKLVAKFHAIEHQLLVHVDKIANATGEATWDIPLWQKEIVAFKKTMEEILETIKGKWKSAYDRLLNEYENLP